MSPAGDHPRSQYLHAGPLEIATVQNAFSNRFEIGRMSEPSLEGDGPTPNKFYFCGSIYDREGTRVETSVRTGGLLGDHVVSLNPDYLDPRMMIDRGKAGSGTRHYKGRTLYLGPWMNQYGHHITETLSRLWFNVNEFNFDNIVSYPFIFNKGKVNIHAFHRYFLRLLDIDIEKLSILINPCLFDEIIIPEQGWVMNGPVNSLISTVYDKIRNACATLDDSRYIFLSRHQDRYDRISNVADVEAVFSDLGFKVIYPETLSIEEQISLYANCEILAGPSGSGLHNCVFTRPGTVVVQVNDVRSGARGLAAQIAASELSKTDLHTIPYVGTATGQLDIRYLAAIVSDILLGTSKNSSRQVAANLTR